MAGMVEYRKTAEARLEEIEKWSEDPWYPVLTRLNKELESLDPDYVLVQVKAKFGGLRYYIEIDPEVRGDADDLIYIAEYNCYAIDKKNGQ